jgi:predicted nuclease of predicted toxin-antitoxin system
MKFLANENFPLSSVIYLKNKGFDIIYIGTDNQSISDRQVLSIALKQNRTILTFDRDYGELIFRYNIKPPKGIIYLRLTKYTPEEPGHIIEELVQTKMFKPDFTLTVVDKKGIRQRKY